MQNKRRRVSAASLLVNAGAGLILLLGAAACRRGADTTEPVAKAPPIPAGIELPAIWSTTPLKGAVGDIALSTGATGMLAVAYERGGLEFFNLDGERIGEPQIFKLKAIADGRSVMVGETPVTVFPGVTSDGQIKAFIFTPGLMAPTQVDLPIAEERSVEGLCTGEAGSAGILRLAYWTISDNRTLRTGILSESNGDFKWREEDATPVDFSVSACAFSYDTLVASPRSDEAAALIRGDFRALVSLTRGGPVEISTDLGATSTQVSIRDGISVRAPKAPSAMTAVGSIQAGGYPGGILVLAGETEEGTHQVVFVDPSALTLRGAASGE